MELFVRFVYINWLGMDTINCHITESEYCNWNEMERECRMKINCKDVINKTRYETGKMRFHGLNFDGKKDRIVKIGFRNI